MKLIPTMIVMLALSIMIGLALRIITEYNKGLPVYTFTIVDIWMDWIPAAIMAMIALIVVLVEYIMQSELYRIIKGFKGE